MKQYIIDANNLMHKIKTTREALSRSLQISQNLLIEIIKNFASRYPNYQFNVVFDGKCEPYSSPPKKITILESGSLTADEIIKSLIKELRIPHECTVISSDTSVYNYARLYGCITKTSEDFEKLLLMNESPENFKQKFKQKDKEKPTHTSKKDLNYYRSVFGESDDNSE
jgi:predicted RNA-binding protein with PIN domain